MKKHYYRALNQIPGIGYGGSQGPYGNPALSSDSSLEEMQAGFQKGLQASYSNPPQTRNSLLVRLNNILKNVSNYANHNQLRIHQETLDADAEKAKISIDSTRLAIEQKKQIMDTAFSCAMRALSA